MDYKYLYVRLCAFMCVCLCKRLCTHVCVIKLCIIILSVCIMYIAYNVIIMIMCSVYCKVHDIWCDWRRQRSSHANWARQARCDLCIFTELFVAGGFQQNVDRNETL